MWSRAVVSLGVGIAGGIAVGAALGVAAGLIAGWGLLAIVEVVGILARTWPMGPSATRAHATREDPGRRVTRLASVVGSVASLGGVAVVLVQTKSAPLGEAIALAAVAVVSVAASWFLIQANYMLRYAHIWFQEPSGGIEFHATNDPMYTDFIYFSVGLGMTYQVADTNVGTNEVRRVVIGQTVIAWVYATAIIATVLNLVTGIGPS